MSDRFCAGKAASVLCEHDGFVMMQAGKPVAMWQTIHGGVSDTTKRHICHLAARHRLCLSKTLLIPHVWPDDVHATLQLCVKAQPD